MWSVKRGSKYGNKKKEYGGKVYHSKAEAQYAKELDLRMKAKDIIGWDRQVKIPLDVNGKHIANYYMDFVVTCRDATLEFVEVKGFETETWRLKFKLLEALYGDDPNIKIVVVRV